MSETKTGARKLLAICDDPQMETGFSRVARNLLRRWAYAKSGIGDFGLRNEKVEINLLPPLTRDGFFFERIDIWGINYFGVPCPAGAPEVNEFLRAPFRMYPAHLSRSEPWYGASRLNALLEHIEAGDYTHLWVMQDHFHLAKNIHAKATMPRALFEVTRRKGITTFYYVPVDGAMRKEYTEAVRWMDWPVAYTAYGATEIKRAAGCPVGTGGDLNMPIGVLPHGADPEVYRPIARTREEKEKLRGEFFEKPPAGSSAPSFLQPGDVVLINVNMHQRRKDCGRSLEILKALRGLPGGEKYKLVMHMNRISMEDDIDLEAIGEHLGLKRKVEWDHSTEVFKGPLGLLTEEQLNELYNCADGYLTTTLGEGWGFGMTEALAAGLPVFAPDHTACAELEKRVEDFGGGEVVVTLPLEPGFVFLGYDNGVPRPRVSIELAAEEIDLYFKLLEANRNFYSTPAEGLSPQVRDWLNWDRIAGEWLKLFERGQRVAGLDAYGVSLLARAGAMVVREEGKELVGEGSRSPSPQPSPTGGEGGGGKLRARYLNRFWLYLEEEDTAFTPHCRQGGWEVGLTTWLLKELKGVDALRGEFNKPDLFIDVGVNVGYYSMLGASLGVPTIGFEPQDKLFDMLAETRALNRFEQHLDFYKFGLWSSEAVKEFIVPKGHSGAGWVDQGKKPHVEEFDTLTVKVKPLDGWCRQFYPVLLEPLGEVLSGARKRRIVMKIDAEGAEPEIIEGMREFLKVNEVTMVMEWDSRRWTEEIENMDDPTQPKVTRALEFGRRLQELAVDGELFVVEEPTGREVVQTAEELAERQDMITVGLRVR